MTRRTTTVLAALAAAPGAACSDAPSTSGGPPSPPGADDPPPAVAGPELGALVSGTAAYVDGTFVWTDYVFDDRGANLTALSGGDRSDSGLAGGDVKYPDAAAPGNTADLVQLQVSLEEEGIGIAAILASLVSESLPVVGVAFDVDGDPETGATTLPGQQWLPRGRLGVEHLVVVSSAGGELWTATGDDWDPVRRFPAEVDAERNLLATVVSRDVLDPGRATWRAFAVAGIALPAGSWVTGAAPIFDLALVGAEPLIRWQDVRQADVLGGALDAGEAAALIDFARIADGVSEATPPGPGFHTFLYHSALRLPEGVTRDDNGNPTFLSPYQPYAIYLPADAPAAGAPATIFLHGLQQNHLGAVFVGADDSYLGTGRALSEDPYQLETLGFAGDGFDFPPHAIQAYPLARGAALSYRGIAHRDVIDVTNDVRRRFAIDPDRIALHGASMGGIGAYRLGTLEPDRWSAIVPLIGFQAEHLLPLSVNLLNVPVRQVNGGMDPLIEEPRATASAARLGELGYDYRYWLLFGRGHEAGGFAYDCVYEEVPSYVRDRRPARVVYARDASLDEVDPASGLELRFDGAYWVDGIVARDPAALANVDATSLALERHEVAIRRIDETHDDLSGGRDLCGPNPEVQSGDTWRERGVVREPGAALPRANALEATLANVAAVTLDGTLAGLDPAAPATVTVRSDGETAVSLSGLGARRELQAAGSRGRSDAAGNAIVTLPAGESVIEIDG